MDDETFFAWLDGELDADRARIVEAEVRASPEMTAKAQAHRALGARLSAAFDPIAAAPAPVVVNFERERVRRRGWTGSVWQNAMALAATLVVGLFLGSMVGDPSGPVAGDGNRLVAANALASALDTRLASAPAADGPRIGLTFRDPGGQYCRSFTDRSSSGLACHKDGQWVIRGLFQRPEGQDGAFRMASGPDPQLAALVESTIAGEPFDAAAERRAQQAGWR